MAREEVGFWACNFRNAGLLTGHVHDEEVHWSLFDRGKGRVPGPLCPQVGVAVSRPAGFGVHNLQVTGRVFITLMTSHLAVLDTLCVDWNRLIQPFTHFFSTYYPWLFSMKSLLYLLTAQRISHWRRRDIASSPGARSGGIEVEGPTGSVPGRGLHPWGLHWWWHYHRKFDTQLSVFQKCSSFSFIAFLVFGCCVVLSSSIQHTSIRVH